MVSSAWCCGTCGFQISIPPSVAVTRMEINWIKLLEHHFLNATHFSHGFFYRRLVSSFDRPIVCVGEYLRMITCVCVSLGCVMLEDTEVARVCFKALAKRAI